MDKLCRKALVWLGLDPDTTKTLYFGFSILNYLDSENSVSVTGAVISYVKLPTAICLFAEDSLFTKSKSRYIPWNIVGQQVLRCAIMLSMLTYLGLQRHG